jgi:hypothetical protein
MISGVAFVVIFLTAVFLFMRNYPSDRWFSGVFVVAGGVMAWCAWGAAAAETGAEEAGATEAAAGTGDGEGEGVGAGEADKVIEATETDPVDTTKN